MNFNVLKPRQAVGKAFEKPGVAIALLLVLLPSIVSLIIFLAFNATIDFAGFLLNYIVRSYAQFFLVVVLFYVAAFIIKGKGAVQGKFSGILSAVSLIWIIVLVSTVLGIVAIPMIVDQSIIDLTKQVREKNMDVKQFYAELTKILEENPDAVNFSALNLFLGIAFVLLFFKFLIFYFVTSKLFNARILGNIIVALILFFVLGFAPI